MTTLRTYLRQCLIVAWLVLSLGVAGASSAPSAQERPTADRGDTIIALDGSARVIRPDAVTSAIVTKHRRLSASPPQWPLAELASPEKGFLSRPLFPVGNTAPPALLRPALRFTGQPRAPPAS